MLINEYFKLILILPVITLSLEIFHLLTIKRVIKIFKTKYML